MKETGKVRALSDFLPLTDGDVLREWGSAMAAGSAGVTGQNKRGKGGCRLRKLLLT